jgi:hypothetical protein
MVCGAMSAGLGRYCVQIRIFDAGRLGGNISGRGEVPGEIIHSAVQVQVLRSRRGESAIHAKRTKRIGS